MASELDTWLDQVTEEALEPELPVCDPHHHMWDYPESRYMPVDLIEDVKGHNVVSTVFVECTSAYRTDGPESMKPVGETEFMDAIAKEYCSGDNPEIAISAGIVSFADLCLGKEVTPVLEAHMAASPDYFRGIRHACGWDASDEIRNSHTKPFQHLYLDKTFREGLACLEALNLTFDAWCYHTQILELVDMARAHPGVSIILDHFGGPLGIGPYAGKCAEIFVEWKKDIEELAKCPNVVMKLGGLAMPINGWDFHKRNIPIGSEELAIATAPYYLHCIEKFGVDRCMFESNFPVDRKSCSFMVLWNSFKRIAENCTPNEKAALFHDTAAKVYKLKY
jgi:predicted TIM-barrel fold metal-dependent hydrolase